jgi:hypothetical protein
MLPQTQGRSDRQNNFRDTQQQAAHSLSIEITFNGPAHHPKLLQDSRHHSEDF